MEEVRRGSRRLDRGRVGVWVEVIGPGKGYTRSAGENYDIHVRALAVSPMIWIISWLIVG